MAGHLDSIVALNTTLTELVDAEERLEGIPDWMQELHEEHSQRKEEIDAVVEAADEAARSRREAEAALADAQTKLEHFQSQIGRVSTQREYGALLKEIDTIKEQISGHERQALEALETHETSVKEREGLDEAFSDLDQRYKTELAKWESEKPGVAATVKDLRKRGDEIRGQIPRPYQVLFDRLWERTGRRALAPVARIQPTKKNANLAWHCTACNYRVRPQVVVEIRNLGALIQCDSCKRILHVDPASEDES